MAQFYNPYHFVPVAKRSAEQKKWDLTREQLAGSPETAACHDRYVPGTHSGRLICRLTTVTPTVPGGRQSRKPGEIATVENHTVDGRPAVAGSALRGMVSSLVESASNSALRVLTKGVYSYRKPFDPKYTLSAIGVIVAGENGELTLRPVVLPTLEKAKDGRGRDLSYFAVPPRFRRIFPQPQFRVYVGDKRSIRDERRAGKTSAQPEHVYKWTVRRLGYNGSGGVDDAPSLHCKPNPQNRRFAVAQLAEGGVEERVGWMRVLGCWGDREQHIPEGKKHELWLPVPGPEAKALPIQPLAIERFHSLADERTEASVKARGPAMPFHPLDTPRNADPKTLGQKFRLKPFDLVYFDVTERGEVCEIALAAIWRGRVERPDGGAAGAHEFFEAVDPDLVPFHPGRNAITIAEQMFGFVEEIEDESGKPDRAGLGLASRIRFADALLADGVTADAALEADPVALKILGSPKPPSPALYFKPAQGPAAWIAKRELQPGKHHPQGRKMYLHHAVAEGTQPWKTQDAAENKDQKNRVRPVRKGQTFYFHVDYDNLTDIELGLLLYGLSPAAEFHHKLGMGKPLGLGSVKVDVLARMEVERAARYSAAGLVSGRYSAAALTAEPAGWPARYERESRAAAGRAVDPGFWELRDDAVGKGAVGADMHRAILALGDMRTAPPSSQIHTPTVEGQADAEGETFRWFVANDQGLKEDQEEIPAQKKALRPIKETGGRVGALEEPRWQERRQFR